jgi:hypothetical protein
VHADKFKSIASWLTVSSLCFTAYKYYHAYSIYLSGLCALKWIEISSSVRAIRLRQMLHSLDVTSQQYHPDAVWKPNAVYVKIDLETGQMYVGCSSQSVYQREQSRLRKLAQLKKDPMVNAERFIKATSENGSYPRFVTIALLSGLDSIYAALDMEFQMICLLKPFFNSNRFSKLAGRNSYRQRARFIKLWRRTERLARSKHHDISPEHIETMSSNSRKHAMLNSLCMQSYRGFLAQRMLMRKSCKAEFLYAYKRMLPHVSTQKQSVGNINLRRVFRIRKLQWPRRAIPLSTPLMAHQSFKQDLKEFLRSIINRHKYMCLPLHIPKATVVESKYMTIGKILHNFREVPVLSDTSAVVCKCQALQSQYPELLVHGGHIASPLDKFGENLNPILRDICKFSSNAGVYPDQEKLQGQIINNIIVWLKHHGMWKTSLQPLIVQFMQGQLVQHQLHVVDRFQVDDVLQLRSLLPHMIFHCEDHKASCLMVYCPKLYAEMLSRTFYNAPAIFSPVHGTPMHIATILESQFPSSLRSVYKKTKKMYPKTKMLRLPSAFVLPKSKKAYTTARPVVMFHRVPHVPLLRSTARILSDIASITFKDITFACPTVASAFRQLRKFQCPRAWSISNQDLVGFFTSVPQCKIMQNTKTLLLYYCRDHHLKLTDKFQGFSGNHYQQTIRTSTQKSRQHLTLTMQQILDLVEWSLNSSYFTIGNRVFHQRQGSVIGSPLSPVLCSIAIAFSEVEWFQQRSTTEELLLPVRYVDNLLTVGPSTWEGWHRNFYGHPIELEPVADQHMFLGFSIEFHKAKLTARMEISSLYHPYVSCRAAGSLLRRLSGLKTRAFLAFKFSCPYMNKVRALHSLAVMYQQAGFRVSHINEALKSFRVSLRIEDMC